MDVIRNIIKEATFEKDQAIINLAKKYIAKIKEYLDTYDGKENNVIDFHGDKGYITVKVGELQIVLMDSRYYRGSSGGYVDNTIASHNIQFKFDSKTKKLSYKLNESNILHELIHYFDDKRSTKGAISKTGEKQERGRADDSYFNNPYEFNANFLQQVFPKVEEYILKSSEVPETFEVFKNEIMRGNGKLRDFYNYLNKKNKHKFLKRLYNIYRAVKHGETEVKKELSDKNLENAPEYEHKKKQSILSKIKNFFSKEAA